MCHVSVSVCRTGGGISAAAGVREEGGSGPTWETSPPPPYPHPLPVHPALHLPLPCALSAPELQGLAGSHANFSLQGAMMKTPSSLPPAACVFPQTPLKGGGGERVVISSCWATALSVPCLTPGALEGEPTCVTPARQGLRLTRLSRFSSPHPQCGLSYARGQS